MLAAALGACAAALPAAVPGAAPGASAHPRPRIERVSVAADGTQGNASSSEPAISADGRYAAFLSRATTLPPDAPHTRKLYLKDLRTGAVEQANVGNGSDPGLRWVDAFSLSATGRYVAFSSTAEQNGPGHVTDQHVYVRDRLTGRTEPLLGAENGKGYATSPAISADGRYVAFTSDRTDLVPGGGSREWHVYVRDRRRHTTRRVSVASDGSPANALSHWPVISADGGRVGFHSPADNLGAPRTHSWPSSSFYVHDLRTGRTLPAARTRDGRAAETVLRASLGPDGRYAAFSSATPGIVPGPAHGTTGVRDCYVTDLRTGSTRRVNLARDGSPTEGDCSDPVMAPDGRRVFFTSDPDGIVPGSPGRRGVYVRDLRTGVTERVDVSAEGAQGDAASGNISVDRSGHRVPFDSWARNLVPGDTNDTGDVFLRRLP
ncbi:hypothetical protein AC230_16660 [Streptomyces caatingaensis]|uniref:WD40 domain protein beta propeller n=1 Tax=Streptomyces caatingaensis TaxID=1678637 RepID=A0A0K9XER4_9ACTN|nr:hypothetical protein AC230_16660 [Streptomyces caatingaensis]